MTTTSRPGLGLPDLDEIGERFMGDRVEFGGRDEDPSVGSAGAENAAVAQSGDEGSDGRPGGSCVVELQIQRCAQRWLGNRALSQAHNFE